MNIISRTLTFLIAFIVIMTLAACGSSTSSSGSGGGFTSSGKPNPNVIGRWTYNLQICTAYECRHSTGVFNVQQNGGISDPHGQHNADSGRVTWLDNGWRVKSAVQVRKTIEGDYCVIDEAHTMNFAAKTWTGHGNYNCNKNGYLKYRYNGTLNKG